MAFSRHCGKQLTELEMVSVPVDRGTASSHESCRAYRSLKKNPKKESFRFILESIRYRN